MSQKRNVIIMGAAGRDFHNFNTFFRNNPNYNVVAFTASAQVLFIAGRTYPAELAGARIYPKGIPIYDENKLIEIIQEKDVDEVFFSYSDVTYEYIMHIASKVIAASASFTLLGTKDAQLKSKDKPVISILATRTGAGKSTIARMVVDAARRAGLRPVVIRHPMPYGDLSIAVQHYKTLDDLDRYNTTIEGRRNTRIT
jgi:predicted GTPase